MNNVAIIKSGDLMSILSLGEDITKELRENNQVVIGAVDRLLSQDGNSVIKNLERIMNKIDIEEISNFQNRKSGISGLIDRVKNTKKQLEQKYTSILKELGAIETGTLTWKRDIKEVDSIFADSKERYSKAMKKLISLKTELEVELEALKLEPQNTYNTEKQNIMLSKISDIDKKILGIKQANEEIDLLRFNNYNAFKLVTSTYDTTVPMLEMMLSVKSTTAFHRLLTENVKYTNERTNELITATAEELIRSGEEIIEALGDNGSIVALQEANKTIEQGRSLLENKQKEQILKLQQNLDLLRLEEKKC